MAVVIRLMRAGAKKRPFYRVVAADSRRQRDGRFIEILGHYNPIAKPYALVIQKEKVERWIAQGARPSEQVASLLRTVGVRTGGAASKPKKASANGAAAKPARKAARKPRALSARKTKKKAARKAAKKKTTAAAQ